MSLHGKPDWLPGALDVMARSIYVAAEIAKDQNDPRAAALRKLALKADDLINTKETA